jgi:endonuclease/exonuclease/phosphatase family metal-dependent hydrolase
VHLLVRRRADRSGSSVALLLAALGCALVLCLTGCRQSSGQSAALAREPSTYTLLQMNLCLSGLGGCIAKTAYPAVLDEAVARIRALHPDAVTVNEACGNDVARIARRTGYHLRFSTVIYGGKPFACIKPGGRGVFGDAVITRAPITSSESQPFPTQAGIERRQWVCATTRGGVDVCTAHLATRDHTEIAANGPQCGELRALLARRAAAGPVIFGGDVNRHPSCAPRGLWTRTDRSGFQDPGIQHVYGSGAFRSPSAKVVPAAHTDHDFLLVRARLTARR